MARCSRRSGSLGGGAIGSNAANEAARLQSQALNRGIDLQTAQWLQQQQNLAPYLQAGQGGLAQLQQLAGREQPSMASSYPTQVKRQWYDYGVPSATPGWTPQDYGTARAERRGLSLDARQGPQAQDYRYTPGQTPDAAAYRYTPGAVPTLYGQELLANDPGVQFRMDEGRKALEASAAARGGLLSGPTLAALQRQGQELSSQEYGQAWNRASQQAQTPRGLGADEPARWALGRPKPPPACASRSIRLPSSRAGAGAGRGGLSGSRWRSKPASRALEPGAPGPAESVYAGLAECAVEPGPAAAMAGRSCTRTCYTNNQLMYGRDTAENQTNYDREQARYRQQLAQHLLPWEQASTLANLGGQATEDVRRAGRLGPPVASVTCWHNSARRRRAGPRTRPAAWMNALQNVGAAGQGYLQNNAPLGAWPT